MKRLVKFSLIPIVIVVIIGATMTVESSAWICPLCVHDSNIYDLAAKPDHNNQEIKITWTKGNPNLEDVTDGYHLRYWVGTGSKTYVSVSGYDTNYWTHTNPTVETTYKYEVAHNLKQNHKDGDYATPVSAKIKTLPSVTSASFSESTNTITLNTNQNIGSLVAANVCVFQTIMKSTVDGDVYEQLDRCGNSASVSGKVVTIGVSGEIPDHYTMSSESIGIAKGALKNADGLGNLQQEICTFNCN